MSVVVGALLAHLAGDYPPPEIDWTNIQLPPNSGGSSTHGDA